MIELINGVKIMAIIALFGSGIARQGSYEYDTAEFAGLQLAEKGYDILTGGFGGVMEAGLKGAYNSDVKRIGVTSKFQKNLNLIPNLYINEEFETGDYLNRMTYMLNRADAYLVFPGGTGTLLELSAAWALKERGMLADKPLIVIGEQWQEVIQIMSFYSETIMDNIALIHKVDTVHEAIEIIESIFNKK